MCVSTCQLCVSIAFEHVTRMNTQPSLGKGLSTHRPMDTGLSTRPLYTQAKASRNTGKGLSTHRQRSLYTQAKASLHTGKGLSTHRPMDTGLSTRPLDTQASRHVSPIYKASLHTGLSTQAHRHTAQHRQIECRLYTGIHTALNPSMSTVYTYEIAYLGMCMLEIGDRDWDAAANPFHSTGVPLSPLLS